MRSVLLTAAVIAAATPVGLYAARPAPLQPTGKWIVDYAKDECFLSRDYGSPEKPLLLAIRRFPMDDDLTIQLFIHGDTDGVNTGDALVSFGGSQSKGAEFLSYRVAGTDLRKVKIHIHDGASLIVSNTEILSVDARGELNEIFALPNLAGALQQLDKCRLDLGQSWGIPPEQQLRIKVPPKPLREDFLLGRDYPEEALRKSASGRSQVRLTVDETGKPIDCIPMKSMESAAFAATTCRALLQRASFHPAIDIQGKPMKSIYVYSVDWLFTGS